MCQEMSKVSFNLYEVSAAARFDGTYHVLFVVNYALFLLLLNR